MKIPTGWHYLTTDLNGLALTHETRAFFRTEEFVVAVTHATRNMTLIHVYEPDVAEGFDFENRDRLIEWGAHNTPEAAFRFAEVYLTRTEDFRPARRFGLSDRYSAAVTAAYAA